MTIKQKKVLYESIMKSVAKTVKRALNEASMFNDNMFDDDEYHVSDKISGIMPSEIVKFVRTKLNGVSVSPITLEDLYNDNYYELACVEYIVVEDPELIFGDDVSEKWVNAYNEYNEAGGEWKISDSYAYEDSSKVKLDQIALMLSKKFPNLLFGICHDAYEHGDPNDGYSGEFVDGYLNGANYDKYIG